MKFNIVLVHLFLFIFLANCQRETFSQRRQRLMEERKRQRSSTTESPTTMVYLNESTSIVPPTESLHGQLTIGDSNLTTIGDEFEFVTKMKVSFNFEQYLLFVPSSLGVVATLLMAAGQTNDFALNDNPPMGGFQFMKYPDSFRRSLFQISQESYDAFLMAHINMNKIRLSTLTLPAYMDEAIRILATRDLDLIKEEFFLTLKVINVSISDNMAYSKQVAKRFEMLSNLTNEIHMASTMSHSTKESQLSELKTNQTIAERSLQSFVQQQENMRKHLQAEFDRFDSNAEELVEAYKSIPTPFESGLMDFVQIISKTLKIVFGGLPAIIHELVSIGSSKSSNSKGTSNKSKSDPIDADACIYSSDSNTIFQIYATSATWLDEYNTLESIDSKNGRYNCTKDVNILKDFGEKATNCSAIASVIDKGIEAVQKMHDLAHVKSIPEEGAQEMVAQVNQNMTSDSLRTEEFNRVRNRNKEFFFEAEALKNKTLNPAKTKVDLSNVTDPSQNESAWTSKRARANAMYKISVYNETLRALREAMDRNLKTFAQTTENSINLLNTINAWKFDQMTTENAIAMLQKGIILMNDLKENWSKLVEFFSAVSNAIETIGGQPVQDLVIHLETTVNSKSYRNTGPLKTFVINSIKKKLGKANQVTTFIHKMMSTYYRISNEYFMPRVSTLDSLMKFRNSSDFSIQQELLIQSCMSDESDIRRLIESDWHELMEEIEKRTKKVQVKLSFLDRPDNY